MIQSLKKRFLASEAGSLSIETVIIVPILAWAMLGTYVFFDAFKTQYLSQKATYTIADMISRQEVPIDDDFITGAHEMFTALIGTGDTNALRISVVTMGVDEDTAEEQLELVWSEGVNTSCYSSVTDLEDRVPTLAEGEHLIIVESAQSWSPVYNVGMGLGNFKFNEMALTRPRFSPQICWEDDTTCSATCAG